jgi:hypothetical protein
MSTSFEQVFMLAFFDAGLAMALALPAWTL